MPRPTHQPTNLATSSSLWTACVRRDYGRVGAFEEVGEDEREDGEEDGDGVPEEQLEPAREPLAQDDEERLGGFEGVRPDGYVFDVF